jgi:hypothetical protein
MNDPIALGALGALMLLLIFGAYHCGFARGLAHGFRAGQRSAQVFARMKRSEQTPQRNGNQRE